MEYDLTYLWIAYIVSFFLTWAVGLSVPLLIRYVFLKRVINKTSAIVIVIILFFLQLALWTSLGSTSKSHAVLFFIAYVSYEILRKPEKGKNDNISQLDKISNNNPKSKKETWIVILLIVVIAVGILSSILIHKQNLLIENLTLPKTNKDFSTFEQIGNLYRNIQYNFRIKFPEGWEIKPGDDPNILQKAVIDNYTISVGAREMPADLIAKTATIRDLILLSEFKDSIIEGVGKKFSGVKVLHYGETKLDNIPAYWTKYSASYSVLDKNIEFTFLFYQLLYKNIVYFIGACGPTSKFMEMEQEFKKSISTFVIENY